MWGAIGNIVSGAIGAGVSGSNTAHTNAMNAKLTREAWAREDNRFQREAADKEAAGINRLYGITGGGSVQSPIPMQSNNVGEIISDSGGKIADSLLKDKTVDKYESEKESIDIRNTIEKWDFGVTKGDEEGRRYKDSNHIGQVVDLLNDLRNKVDKSGGMSKMFIDQLLKNAKTETAYWKSVALIASDKFKEGLSEMLTAKGELLDFIKTTGAVKWLKNKITPPDYEEGDRRDLSNSSKNSYLISGGR